MISLAVLDVAGTTVNVANGVLDAFMGAFASHGIALTADDVLEVRGISKRAAIRSLVERTTGRAPRGDEVEAVLDAFRSSLLEWSRHQPITAVPGADAAIRTLRARGVSVWLSTGFDRAMAELVVARAGLQPLLDGLATDDDVERGRPAPDLIRFAMERAGVGSGASVVTAGDTRADLDAAAAAGVRCSVGVLTGAHSRELLASRPHDLVLDSVAELATALERLGLLGEGRG